MSAALQLTGVSAGYGHQLVIRDVSLEVAEGQLAALIGPNGHGKTTLLRAISGLVRTRQGAIALHGRRIDRLRPDEVVAAGIVHVPQGDLLFPDMTVIENLRMGAYLPEAGRVERQRLDEVLSLFPKLDERRHQVASTLSGGERRMVGIGRGLMSGGRLLMLDEPSLGLAPIVIDQIYAAIAALRQSGRTIVVVEENATRIAEISDAVHLLDNGSFAWSGSGRELLSRPEILSSYLGG
ncbi:MAG: ABC transporter ATP-binding protein [Alphaproteobacteria bacterium]|nr:ABC transporter ATP-binding protein [Alphaproteobacteria bacterium]